MKTFYMLNDKNELEHSVTCSDDAPPMNGNYTTVPIKKRIYMGEKYVFNKETNLWDIESYSILPEYNEFTEDVYLDMNTCSIKKVKREENKDKNLVNSDYNYFIDKVLRASKDYEDEDKNRIKRTKKDKVKEISVLIPCYNKSLFILETVKSVLNQTVLPDEIYITLMDEKSIAMEEEIKSLSPIIKTEATERRNVADSKIYLAEKCSSKDFIFLDGDDLLESNFIEECKKSKSYFMYTKVKTLTDGEIVAETPLTKSYCANLMVGNITGLINKEKFYELGGIDDFYKVMLEDVDFKRKIADSNYHIDINNNTSFIFRRDTSEEFKNSSVMSQTSSLKDFEAIMTKYLYNNIDFFFSRMDEKNIEFTDVYNSCKLISNSKTKFTDSSHEIINKYIAMIHSKIVEDYSKEIVIDKNDIKFFMLDLIDIIKRVPYVLFDDIELINKTDKYVSEDITALVFANNNDNSIIKSTIDSIKANNIKNIIVLTNDTFVIDTISSIEGVSIIKSDEKDIRKASKIMAKETKSCLLYTSPSPRDKRQSRMPSSA